MQKLLISRKNKGDAPEPLEKIEPEKYGKGAYCELSYTPSKLADHILFKDAHFLKKLEEEVSKNRNSESKNKVLGDQVDYLKRERDGIETALRNMIAMYKAIIDDMEKKNDERIANLQIKFKEEIQVAIREKGEEAKYVQSEKQILENRIQELEGELEGERDKVYRLNRSRDELQKDLDALTIEHRHLDEKYEGLRNRFEEKCEESKKEIDGLKRQFMTAEVDWKNNLREELHKKDLEMEQAERTHKAELENAENQRKNTLMTKNQQINDLTKTFDDESKRMKEIIGIKDKMVDTLQSDNNKEKARVIALTKDYESEITHLSHERNRLLEEIQLYARDNDELVKEKAYITDDLEKENLKLRELLYESSQELEKCKSELVSLARDNAKLLTRVKSSEEEAKTWRDSYYISKNRPT